MTQEEFKTLNILKEKLDNDVNNLWSYLKEKHLDCLKFGKYSSFHHYNFYRNEICIEYNDYGCDYYDSSEIDVPTNEFIDQPTEWADEWANSIREEKKKEMEEQIKQNEKKEREILKRLKEKYEQLKGK